MFLTLLGNKALKSRAFTLHGNKTKFYQNLPLSVFELLTYQNAKTHAKHPLWRNRITLPKTCILSVFDHATHKNDEIHGKNTMFVKRKDITRNICFECF